MNPKVAAMAMLEVKPEETVGPKTNSRTVSLFHPDMSQTSPDRGRAELAIRGNFRSCWLPTNLQKNIKLNQYESLPKNIFTGQITGEYLYGAEGQYVKNEYAAEISPDYPPPTAPPDRQWLSVSELNV